MTAKRPSLQQAPRSAFGLMAFAAAILATHPAPAFSQEIGANAIEEIVVTAQRREKSLLDVPLSMSAVGQKEMEAGGLTSMSDFFRRVPSVAVID